MCTLRARAREGESRSARAASSIFDGGALLRERATGGEAGASENDLVSFSDVDLAGNASLAR